MDNQHKLIKGYRDLSPAEIDLMNEVKAHAEKTRDLLTRIGSFAAEREAAEASERELAIKEGREVDAPPSVVTSPLRWLSIGQTDLQQGFMAVVRAIARPTTF